MKHKAQSIKHKAQSGERRAQSESTSIRHAPYPTLHTAYANVINLSY